MPNPPDALDSGVVLHDRFQIDHVLGRGGFGITYLAIDLERHDSCVVKELAPPGAVRTADGDLSFAALGAATAQRLRHQFVQEAGFLGRLRARGIIPIRVAWQERGTSYFAMDFVSGSMTLQKQLLSEGRMDASAVLDIIYQLLETLDQIHGRGLLHRDIKPSNVLVNAKGEAFLIDFGSAREWHADLTSLHTVQYTPGYAPLEQMSEQARRGPATDLYALSALAYALLTGVPPTSAAERAAGAPLIGLQSIRPDVEPRISEAITKGLALKFEERPQSAAAMRALLDNVGDDGKAVSLLSDLDARIVRLQRFKFGRRECPGCGGLLEEPKPLKVGWCPVCQEGAIRARKIPENSCPVCRVGVLQKFRNDNPLRICPSCAKGLLVPKGLLKKKTYSCDSCGATYATQGELWTRESDELAQSVSEWRIASGRSAEVRRCDGCGAQFDTQDDGRLRQVEPRPKSNAYVELFADEWARVAAGLEPGAGNAACESCQADYFQEGDSLTLLAATRDPYRFADRHLGQLLRRDSLRWLGVGKSSGAPGLLCASPSCGTEFDGVGDVLSLVRSEQVRLHKHQGESLTLANWHRVAQGLPKFGEEPELLDQVPEAMRIAYRGGDLAFDSRDPALLWRGPGERFEQGDQSHLSVGQGQFSLDGEALTFGGLLRKLRMPLAEVLDLKMKDDWILVRRNDGSELLFELEPVIFSARLDSGRWETTLEATDLVARFAVLQKPKSPDR